MSASLPDTTPSSSDSPTVPKVFRRTWREVAISLVGSWVLRLLASTLRFRVENLAWFQNSAPEPFIFVFWHNRTMLIPVAWNRYLSSSGRPVGKALTSTSRDGELLAQFIGRFGVGHVRGSATRRGSTALRELARWLAKGHDVGITPDGSRGPMYEIKPGLVLLAQLSGKRILPISFEYSSAWRLKSWDRFFIPKPFSKVTFIVGNPFEVRRTGTPDEFEDERLRCQQAILATTVER